MNSKINFNNINLNNLSSFGLFKNPPNNFPKSKLFNNVSSKKNFNFNLNFNVNFTHRQLNNSLNINRNLKHSDILKFDKIIPNTQLFNHNLTKQFLNKRFYSTSSDVNNNDVNNNDDKLTLNNRCNSMNSSNNNNKILTLSIKSANNLLLVNNTLMSVAVIMSSFKFYYVSNILFCCIMPMHCLLYITVCVLDGYSGDLIKDCGYFPNLDRNLGLHVQTILHNILYLILMILIFMLISILDNNNYALINVYKLYYEFLSSLS